MLSESISLERSKCRLSEILPVAVRLQPASSSLKRTFNRSAEFFTGLNHFSPQNPNFDLPKSKFVLKGCLHVYIHQKALKVTKKLEIKTSFQHNSTIQQSFTITFNNNPIHIPNPQL